MPKDLQDLISFLKPNGFRAEGPQCVGEKNLSKTALFDADNFTPDAKDLLNEKKAYNASLQT